MGRLIDNTITITVVILVFAAVLVPIIASMADMTTNGDEITLNNRAVGGSESYYSLVDPTTTPTITYTLATSGLTSSAGAPDSVLTTTFLVAVVSGSSGSMTIQGPTGTTSTYNTTSLATTGTLTFTINVASGTATLTGASSSTGLPTFSNFASDRVYAESADPAAYALYKPTTEAPVYVNSTVPVITMNSTALGSQSVTSNTPVALTESAVADEKNIYMVTAVEGDGSILTSVQYSYYEQIPAMNSTLSTIINIIPIFVVIGIIMACVYLFMDGRRDWGI